MPGEADFSKIAKTLEQARLERSATEQISKSRGDFSTVEAYRVQSAGVRLRATKGERVIGYKMGLTSKAKMQQVGVSEAIYGVLTDTMQFADGADVSLLPFIHPRIEPEIAFVIGRDIDTILSPAQALQACSGVCVALEIIDSRYKNFSFSLPDVIADNCSAAGFVLGTQLRRPDRDLGNLGIVLEQNGIATQFASSAAILGHPARSLAQLIRLLVNQGETLRAGSVVLSGGATAAVELKVGDWVRAQAQGLGAVSIKGVLR